eukprot:Phypoly_transcript_16082.p1 GENE.Phypoly_transcript_16082~~Phypoly_transcript_16082.p1  ORF type:complete len:232 (+),score=37.90 Phypoly_transcript_16082:128-823(+)
MIAYNHPLLAIHIAILASLFAAQYSMVHQSNQFLDFVKNRRTFYQISNALPEGVTEDKIEDIVKQLVLNVPSAFNSQSTRIVVLFQKEHEKLWDFTTEILKAIVPASDFPNTEKRLGGFKAGYGTILFFEETLAVKKLQESFPRYQDKFPDWSQHTNAMHQFAIWTALESEGLGASLQHYNPLIDTKVKAEWNIPATWSLVAQMPFGKPTGQPNEKTTQPVEERLKVYGKK